MGAPVEVRYLDTVTAKAIECPFVNPDSAPS